MRGAKEKRSVGKESGKTCSSRGFRAHGYAARARAVTFIVWSMKVCSIINHKNYNFLACDWFKNVLFSTNSLAKLLSDSLLLDSLLLDSLLSDSLISQSHSKM